MAEPQVIQEPATTPQVQAEPQIDDVQAKIDAAIAAQSEVFKKEINGLNRRNSDLEKKLQEKDLEKLNVEERAKKELEMAQTERDKILGETISLKKRNAVVNAGLDESFARRIIGNTQEEIDAEIIEIKAVYEKDIKARLEIERNKFFGGNPPTGGNPPQASTPQSMYAEAMKNGNQALAVQIKLDAQRQGIQIQ
jgi:hypothetical protein